MLNNWQLNPVIHKQTQIKTSLVQLFSSPLWGGKTHPRNKWGGGWRENPNATLKSHLKTNWQCHFLYLSWNAFCSLACGHDVNRSMIIDQSIGIPHSHFSPSCLMTMREESIDLYIFTRLNDNIGVAGGCRVERQRDGKRKGWGGGGGNKDHAKQK